jgi:hypothetical protein
MADDTGRDVATTVRKERHWRVIVAQICIPHKRPMFVIEHLVDATVKLILVVWFHRSAYVIIRARRIRQWVVLQYLRGERIKSASWNRIVRECRPR